MGRLVGVGLALQLEGVVPVDCTLLEDRLDLARRQAIFRAKADLRRGALLAYDYALTARFRRFRAVLREEFAWS